MELRTALMSRNILAQSDVTKISPFDLKMFQSHLENSAINSCQIAKTPSIGSSPLYCMPSRTLYDLFPDKYGVGLAARVAAESMERDHERLISNPSNLGGRMPDFYGGRIALESHHAGSYLGMDAVRVTWWLLLQVIMHHVRL